MHVPPGPIDPALRSWNKGPSSHFLSSSQLRRVNLHEHNLSADRKGDVPEDLPPREAAVLLLPLGEGSSDPLQSGEGAAEALAMELDSCLARGTWGRGGLSSGAAPAVGSSVTRPESRGHRWRPPLPPPWGGSTHPGTRGLPNPFSFCPRSVAARGRG